MRYLVVMSFSIGLGLLWWFDLVSILNLALLCVLFRKINYVDTRLSIIDNTLRQSLSKVDDSRSTKHDVPPMQGPN